MLLKQSKSLRQSILKKPSRVDITTRPALHPMLADAILKEAIAL